MIDLTGIARHLRLNVEQIRIAAGLLEQGYQPGFIERYRADETGCLPRSTLWALKLDIDRQLRLQAAREKALKQLPKDAELDEEGQRYLQRAHSEVEIDAALRAFRSRRTLSQPQESDMLASQLLERLLAYQGDPVDNLAAWVASELSIDPPAAEATLHQAARLAGALLHSDTGLHENLRRTIQRKAEIHVQLCEPTSEDHPADSDDGEHPSQKDEDKSQAAAETNDSGSGTAPVDQRTEAASTEAASTEAASTEAASTEAASTENVVQSASHSLGAVEERAQGDAADKPAENASQTEPPLSAAEDVDDSQPTGEATREADSPSDLQKPETHVAPASPAAAPDAEQHAAEQDSSEAQEAGKTETASPAAGAAQDAAGKVAAAADGSTTKSKPKIVGKQPAKTKKQKKPIAKMTPRQRRRRWLTAMLQPMKSLKRPLAKLTAYQQLMLGRGRRSLLVKTDLVYDKASLIWQARDTFVNDKHPFASWFETAVNEALEHSLRVKVEQDAIADLEELAAEKLLETAADQLRQGLMQRPVRGHCILVMDAIGPKAAAVAIVGPDGQVLATEEIACSANPTTVNQNVVRLGELAHQYRVTLVALTNGPARRFLVLTLRELVKQSTDSGLRWTMADRSGADAYAVGRTALRELAAFNRRHRAAIWIARCLQDPLLELLKIDVNRLRLGSFQRELPQEPLKKLVRETISDCIFHHGIDVRKASVDELRCVAGVANEQAQQIATLAEQNRLTTRKQLLEEVASWPESDARQAIGVLRIYGGEQALDATVIHPDDYRLAERIIENTELTAPPSAPPDWQPPAPKTTAADVAVKEPAEATATASTTTDTATTDASAASHAAEAASEQGIAAEASQAGESAGDEAATTLAPPATDSPTAESPPNDNSPASETEASDAAEPAAQPSAEVATEDASGSESPSADSSSPDSSSETAPTEETQVAQPADDEADSHQQAAASTVKPEFPEEVAAIPPVAPKIDVEKLARGWQVGREKLRWIADCLQDPFADPRLRGPCVPLLKEMPTLQNLQPGTCLWAVVVGVADFGAFVELAPDCSGLIHISRLSANYVEDPHQCVQVGDLVMAWVVSVDEKKNRVAMTALSPAERAEAEAAAAKRKAEHGEHRRGRGGQRQDHRSGDSRSGGGRGGQPGGAARGQSAGRDGRRPGGGRPRGGPSAGRGGKGRGGPHSKPVVIKSKKPKAPISEAMKEGDEPLRSFSDLMQFYEAKRTDEPAAASPASAKPSTLESPPASAEKQPQTTHNPAEANSNADAQPTDASESNSG